MKGLVTMIFDKLRKAQRARTKLQKKFDPLISAAEKKEDKSDAEFLIQEFLQERSLLDNRIKSIETARLQEKAEKYGIPTPSLSDQESWDKGYTHSGLRVFLKANARLALLSDIRKERRARWEDRTAWINRLIIPIIALLGAATAFVAVWKD